MKNPKRPSRRLVLSRRCLERLTSIEITLDGPPGEPERGMKVQLDRIRQAMEGRQWLLRTIAVAAISELALIFGAMGYFALTHLAK